MEIRSKENLEKKIAESKNVIRDALGRFDCAKVAAAWTGGKDSTLVLWLIRQVCDEEGLPLPRCFCIDEGDMFDGVREFLDRIREDWNVDLDIIHNDNVSIAAGGKIGAVVKVKDLSERNRKEIERLGYEEEEFSYEPESFVGNHLMKTVTLNVYLEEKRLQGFFEGIRWDEQESRANEKYFTPRPSTDCSPEYMRIFPILHFRERDVWETHFALDIPICSLYEKGYRTLGARITTTKHSAIPAWEQDLENTYERGGRRQDKEHLMKRLRKLGYM